MMEMLPEATGLMMAERRAKRKDRVAYLCHGACNGMLRPWRRLLKEFPGTRVEYSENRCLPCWVAYKRELEPDNPEFAILPCSKCGHSTRPSRERESTAPGTRRRLGTTCTECHVNPSSAKVDTTATVASLDRFMARMRANSNKVRNRPRTHQPN